MRLRIKVVVILYVLLSIVSFGEFPDTYMIMKAKYMLQEKNLELNEKNLKVIKEFSLDLNHLIHREG